MKPALLISKIAAIIIAVALPASATHAADRAPQHSAKVYGDSSRGAVIFEKWCVSCHAVKPQATDQIPTLHQLVANPAHTDNAIRAFLIQPHKPMPPLELSTQEIEDIIAYLHDLPSETGQPH